jgi:SMODS-associating 2TM, beta-strand rich effector domain
MFATLSLKRLLALLLTPYGLLLVFWVMSVGMPNSLQELWRMVGLTTTVWGVVIFILGGFSGRFAPWRLLWQLVPQLNDALFPDLNGVWSGKTSSNWPIIERLKVAAASREIIKDGELDDIALKDDDVALTIKATFFTLRVSAELHGTGSKSHSITERVSRDKRKDKFELYYIYQQDTLQPKATDDSHHLGAASLTFDREKWAMEGPYWTRRSWRQGLNTAGMISVNRVSR